MPIGSDIMKKMRPEPPVPPPEAAPAPPEPPPAKKSKSVQDIVRKIRMSGCAGGR